MKKYRFLSWGLGVQSTWLLVMSGLGMIEPFDCVVVADTQWERKETKEIYEFYSYWAKKQGIKVETVTAGSVKELGVVEHIHLPFWTETGAPLQRQCTLNFKILPIRRFQRVYAGYHPSKNPYPPAGSFELSIGISWDEWDRASVSDVQYVIHNYPLLDKRIMRDDCIEGFRGLGLPVPIKSACIGCPYRDAYEWLEMQESSPDEFEEACIFDDQNRNNPLASRGASTADKLYVWRECIPLREVDFRAVIERDKRLKKKQLPLFCTGQICMV